MLFWEWQRGVVGRASMIADSKVASSLPVRLAASGCSDLEQVCHTLLAPQVIPGRVRKVWATGAMTIRGTLLALKLSV